MNSNGWEKESIGSDESGKGDFFGGPSIVAVYLSKEALSSLKTKSFYGRIRDSKRCEDEWIKQHISEIKEICEYAEITISAKEYNDLYSKFKNANIIFSYLHDKVHKKIEQKSHRIIDAFVAKEKHNDYLKQIKISGINVDEFAPKAESKYLSVALASLIARHNYIRQMEEMSSQTGVKIPFGNSYSGINSVITAYQDLLKQGYSESYIDNNLVKNNFSTLKKIKEIIKL